MEAAMLEEDTPGVAWFEAIVEQAPAAIILADREGLIRVWNRASEALFGFGAAEVLGRSLDVIIPEHLRKAHWEGYERYLAERERRAKMP
jgi:PAS domain S-box-containing protein